MMFNQDIIQIVSSYSSFLSSEFMHKNTIDQDYLTQLFLDIDNTSRKQRLTLCSLGYFKYIEVKPDEVCILIGEKQLKNQS